MAGINPLLLCYPAGKWQMMPEQRSGGMGLKEKYPARD